jgi:hypothetical protein
MVQPQAAALLIGRYRIHIEGTKLIPIALPIKVCAMARPYQRQTSECRVPVIVVTSVISESDVNDSDIPTSDP